MFPYIMSLLLGVSATGTAQNPPSISITFTATIVSCASGKADTQQLLPGVFKVMTEYTIANTEDYGTYKKDYLVVDRLGILKTQPLTVAFGDYTELKTFDGLIVMDWPNLTDKQVIAAFKNSYRRGIMVAMKHLR